ncbi:Hsp20/alpha crystallin family protein [Saccharopolyspora sp. ASAGF58]|uniref:Hsp20/alpha crystallin family protein n=1 Tax=Saccharopolyspora sp. ASAGF58 TaxID=2719023 RepID=UPI0014402BEA|nr:Hsp20/alpha crystallin family protein [Saccharopolyspora sp. ASAGF58]QIZ36514.1 Hsp20/alpha crystallin family protein [Saccharopolyspora sp. ASAGF58]
MPVLQFDPFRDISRLANEVLTAARTPQPMPMDAYRRGEEYVVEFDLPGIDPGSLEVTAEHNTLTVRAQRSATESSSSDVSYLVTERPTGTFARQLQLGAALDADRVQAEYRNGVLTLRIPVAEQAKPRRINVARSDEARMISGPTTDPD